MHTLWSIFETITTIPRCSGNTEAMKRFIIEWAETYDYSVQTDNAGNIYVKHKDAKVCLQAHYDMVCMGNAPQIALNKEGEYLSAKESSLGADNGIGVALMLLLISENVAVDALFTADEEIGLVGARALDMDITTKQILNLDSEEEGYVYIGCAGGVDIVIEKPISFITSDAMLYDVTLEGLPGGHSGVDIDKNILSANAYLSHVVSDIRAKLAAFSGGERRNAIAKRAQATMAISEEIVEKLKGADFGVEKSSKEHVIENSEEVIQLLEMIPHGILRFDEELNMVHTSINYAIVSTTDTHIKIELTLRSMQENMLQGYLDSLKEDFESMGCSVSSSDFYAPWEANPVVFTELVQEKVQKHHNNSALKTMHAGLECGVLQQHLKDAEFVSIGPTIELPHSNNERVHMPSVDRFEACVRDIITTANAV